MKYGKARGETENKDDGMPSKKSQFLKPILFLN